MFHFLQKDEAELMPAVSQPSHNFTSLPYTKRTGCGIRSCEALRKRVEVVMQGVIFVTCGMLSNEEGASQSFTRGFDML